MHQTFYPKKYTFSAVFPSKKNNSFAIVSIFLNGKYLDYNVLASDSSSGQHIGIILVELGVGITVATVMIALYHSFASFRIKDD